MKGIMLQMAIKEANYLPCDFHRLRAMFVSSEHEKDDSGKQWGLSKQLKSKGQSAEHVIPT